MSRKIALIGLTAVLIILGCTQKTTNEVSTCIDYCDNMTHETCNGYWNITGDYPSCDCSWICDNTITPSGCSINWTCTDWSKCSIKRDQSRTCTDANNCNSTSGKPSITQACTFINPCDGIASNTRLNNECTALLYEDYTFCSIDNYTNSCIDAIAKINFSLEVCDKINSSLQRNTCKAQVSNDRTYCNILEPSIRQECYNRIDEFLNYRAGIESDAYYCSLIKNTTVFNYNTCVNQVSINSEFNYLNDYKVCKNYGYTINNSYYQRINSCYVYNIKRLGTQAICEDTKQVEGFSEEFYNECKALIANNITYCYEFTGYKRDRCFASFAYMKNDTNTCRDANDTNACITMVCSYFGNINFCNKLAENLKDIFIYTIATECLNTNWKTCNTDYCSLIKDVTLKNSCIYYTIKDSKVKTNKLRNYI